MAGNQGSGQDPGQDPGAGVQEPGSQQPGQPNGQVQDGQTTPPVNPPAGTAPATPPSDPSSQPSVEPPTPSAEPPKTDWRDRRIGELTARNREQRAELERLRAQVQPRDPNGQFREQPPPSSNDGPPARATIDDQIEQRAQILAANQEFNRRCDEVAIAGRKVYPDFDAQVGRLVGLVDNTDPQSMARYNEFLNAALETGEAAKLIHALGGDLDEASRILSMSPRQMTVALTRMADRPVQELSRAPRPINPAATSAQAQRTSVSPDDPGSDQMSTEEWMRRRNEQIQSRGVRR